MAKGKERAGQGEEEVAPGFTPGAMVWAKLRGRGWWPGMVDVCPDTGEYYWLEAWEDHRRENKRTGDHTLPHHIP